MKRFLLALVMLLTPALALAGDYELEAVGVGTINGSPDEGYITVSVTTVAADAGTALKENTKTAAKLYKSLEELSVERKSIKTLEFTVGDHYREEVIQSKDHNQQPVTRTVKDGFQVTNAIRITVCDLAQFGGVLDTCVLDGATAVNSISFGSSKAEQYLIQARAAAVADAVKKAETISKGLGVRLQGVKRVTEQPAHRAREMYSIQGAADSPGNVPVSGGSLTYSVQVNVTFDIH